MHGLPYINKSNLDAANAEAQRIIEAHAHEDKDAELKKAIAEHAEQKKAN
jgi:hypothetical protein